MYQKIILLIFSGLLLTGCSDSFRGYFKKSANNKWVDAKGFEGGKRKPLYNKKYISMAKKNVIDDNIDEDDDFDEDDDLQEVSDTSKRNRQMYMKMIKRDAMKKNKQKQQLQNYQSSFATEFDDNEGYPSLAEVSKKVASEDNGEQKLQRELSQIKSMLNEAKKDLVRYKCPMETTNLQELKGSQQQQQANSHNNVVETKHTKIIDKPASIEIKNNSQPSQEPITHEAESFNKAIESSDESKTLPQPNAI